MTSKLSIFLLCLLLPAGAFSSDFYLDTGLKKEEVFYFYKSIKNMIENDEKELLSHHISYPITVNEKNTLLLIDDSDGFIKNYDKIVTERVKYTVACTSINDLKSNSYGVMLADGVIWFASVKKQDSDPWSTLITSISNKERKKELWYQCD